MANPTLLTMPLCQNADKNTIPPTDAGTSGLFSEEYGWQNINSLPLASGGKAPNRRDFNGVFALLGGIAYACQRGQTFEWVNILPYLAGCVVTDPLDGNKYNALNDVPAGGINPSLDSTNWEKFGTVDLSGKANITLNNLDTANLSVHVVVDSYYNSTTGDWYRVYDDGWVEQGGMVSVTVETHNKEVTLLKPMADSNYFVSAAVCNTVAFSSSSSSIGGPGANATASSCNRASTTSFYINNIRGNNSEGQGDKRWYVAGMGASV